MKSTPTVSILEDDPDRTREFTVCLRLRHPYCQTVVFDNAPDMIVWLSQCLKEVCLICLDHDLGPNRLRDGQAFDPGTGRNVADWLATQRPVCPVVIHTTNSLAAPGMELVLEDAGWRHYRVVPYDNLKWVREAWAATVTDALGRVE